MVSRRSLTTLHWNIGQLQSFFFYPRLEMKRHVRNGSEIWTSMQKISDYGEGVAMRKQTLWFRACRRVQSLFNSELILALNSYVSQFTSNPPESCQSCSLLWSATWGPPFLGSVNTYILSHALLYWGAWCVVDWPQKMVHSGWYCLKGSSVPDLLDQRSLGLLLRSQCIILGHMACYAQAAENGAQ